VAVKLVALDIDGTLIPHGHDTPPPALREAVRRLQDAGIAVVLASGRMFPGTAKVARELGVSTPVICQQGCSIHDLSGEILHEFPLRHALALSLVDFARDLEHAYEWFNPIRYIASRRTAETEEYGRVSGIQPEYDLAPERSGVRPTGVGVISSREQANGIHRELVAHYGELLHVLDFPAVTVAVAPDANKGHALSLLCRDFGIDRHETVAVGDSVNDAPMLAWAGRGIALGHSDSYALDAADEVLGDEPDALADFLVDFARPQVR
jgi:Cof subfamily protein (haloacid dehalogenase superfamily)